MVFKIVEICAHQTAKTIFSALKLKFSYLLCYVVFWKKKKYIKSKKSHEVFLILIIFRVKIRSRCNWNCRLRRFLFYKFGPRLPNACRLLNYLMHSLYNKFYTVYSHLPPRYALPRYEMSLWYALFSRKTLSSKSFFFYFEIKNTNL